MHEQRLRLGVGCQKFVVDIGFLMTSFRSLRIHVEWPSVRLVRAEAAIGLYLKTPFVSSSPLASCQRKHVTTDTFKNVVSDRINRNGVEFGEASKRVLTFSV